MVSSNRRGRARLMLVGVAVIFVVVGVFAASYLGVFTRDLGVTLLFVGRNLEPLASVGVQLYAFYPTPSGTVLREVFSGFTGSSTQITIPLSVLGSSAEAWSSTYSDYVYPSLLGFASYVLN
ncbi:MAG: hypothetical protein QW688_09350, partial [Thermoprotei archaeon]